MAANPPRTPSAPSASTGWASRLARLVCGSVSSPFPAMKARRLLTMLTQELGYAVVRHEGSHRRLTAPGRPDLTFAFHDGVEVGGVAVRRILVKQVRLSETEALEVIRRA